MDNKERRHNLPISRVIKGYLDKDGGKVAASRKEIEWRFNALDWRYQKQILFAFLQSGMSDRKWAYKKLFAFWDDCFIPVLKDLWEQYHEMELSWIVIRFFPTDYLKKDFKNLNKGRNYYFLYQRLRDDADFVLDRTRLDEADLLAVKYELGENITDGYVMDLFFLLIYKLSKGVYDFRAWRAIGCLGPDPVLTIFCSSKVESLINLINARLERYSLVKMMREWMNLVTCNFMKEYGEDGSCLWMAENDLRWMMKKSCLEYIAPEYCSVWDTFPLWDQQRFLDYLENRNNWHVQGEMSETQTRDELMKSLLESSCSRQLVERFDLEIVDDQ